MQKLSKKEHWDSIYKRKSVGKDTNSSRAKLKRIAIFIFGKYIQNYSDYFLWEVLLNKYLPKTKGVKVLEVGSAPGTTLVRLKQTYGYIPFGVEYSDDGVVLNRAVFAENNINEDNVIKADFFSEGFQNQYKDYFDIVLSVGFIEHFKEVEEAINKHVNLLRPGGHLIVIIPNLRGMNRILVDFFHKEVMTIHNTTIMEKTTFSSLFNEEELSTLYCGYYGTFNFGLFNTKAKSPRKYVLSFCKIIQLFLNMVFHLILRNRGAEHRLFSPYLIYIGTRKTNAKK
jgi:SAM-dependent methyltransferase